MLKKFRLHFFSGTIALSAILCTALHSETLQDTQPSAAEKVDIPQADLLKVSEAFGHFIGRNLNSPGVKFDLESIIKGMREGAAGKPSPMTDKEYEDMMGVLQEKAFKALAESNLKAATDFLTNNANAEGVVEIQPNKLQYVILQKGEGPAVAAHATPKINYTGRYIDGTVFGTSEDVNGPIAVPLDQTIQGFSAGLMGMQEGEKRRLFVHPELGYGTSGHLPPNSLLIFDIELVKADTQDEDTGEESADEEEEDDDDLPPLSFSDEYESSTKAGH